MNIAPPGMVSQSDAARILSLTPAGVAFLSRKRELNLRRTRRGKYILYSAGDIARLAAQRRGLFTTTTRDPKELLQLAQVGA